MLPCVTASDFVGARLADEAGFPLLLVGDSLGTTVLGYTSTLPVTLDIMLHHTAAVARGTRDALVVADMPFLSYQVSVAEGIRNAGRFLQEAGADAVKVEGGAFRAELVSALTMNGIPVLGHIGLTPQSVHAFGGFKVQGKTEAGASQLLRDARAMQEAGAPLILIEAVPAALGTAVTRQVDVPTIGIGAGPDCSGQVLVMHDMLGVFPGKRPRFVKDFMQGQTDIQSAAAAYVRAVKDGTFPGKEHCF